jgi:hypothetical protein
MTGKLMLATMAARFLKKVNHTKKKETSQAKAEQTQLFMSAAAPAATTW